MSQPVQDTGSLFARMDAKARETIERRFRVRLNSAASTGNHQAAWDVYQNTTLKLAQALDGGAEIGDPDAYAATLARHGCSDYWRAQSPEWYELKGRLYRFFRKQPSWAMWNKADVRGSVCGVSGWQDRAMASGSRVAALIDKPRLVASRALPKVEVFQQLTATDWDRLLNGFFSYLDGPVRLDELVSIAGALFGVKGVRELAYDDVAPGNEDDDRPTWEPPARPANTLDNLVIRQQIGRLWAEVKGMPKRWLVPFLLNLPSLKGSQRARSRGGSEEPGRVERGEIDVFTSNGFTTISEICSLVGFNEGHYSILWSALGIEARGGPPLTSVADSTGRFAVVWNFLPLEDELIARLMSLESTQKVINLRMVAKTHLVKALGAAEKTSHDR